jgi:23S rRNA pseudouridine1911/1915/1917 synthase
LREAVSEYKVLQRFANHTLLEVEIKTGRKHQIRCHLAYIHHPVAGDSLYGFKDSPVLEGLNRQFLHASYLKIVLPSGQIQELYSDLPEDLKNIINNLGKI